MKLALRLRRKRRLSPALRGPSRLAFWVLAFFLVSSLAAAPASAQDFAFSLGSWSFFRDSNGSFPFGSPGLFASLGFTWGIAPVVEIGASLIPRITPDPVSDIFTEGHIGISLWGDRVKKTSAPAAYLNALLEAGLMFGARGALSSTPTLSRAFFIRLTPFVLGNPYYGRRDRFFALAFLYDWEKAAASLSFSLIAVDFYLVPSAKQR